MNTHYTRTLNDDWLIIILTKTKELLDNINTLSLKYFHLIVHTTNADVNKLMSSLP